MGKIVKTTLFVAAAAAIIVATQGTGAAFLQAASAGIATSFGVGAVAGAAIFGGLIGAGLGILSSIAAPSAREVGDQAGIKLPVTNAIAGRQIIYGEMRVGGSEVFIEEYNTFESDRGRDDEVPNDALIYVRAVADHPIDGFVSYFMGDREVRFDASKSQNLSNGGNAVGDLRDCLYLSEHDGTQTIADRKLTSVPTLGWGASHVGRGIAYFTVRAQFDQDKYPYGPGEIRSIQVQVRGKKIYDPRLDSTRVEVSGVGPQRLDDPSTWTYSQNPALVIYDFLRDDTLGNPVPDDEIDIQSIVNTAIVCEEAVPVKGGGTIPRYTFNGVIDGNRDKYANISSMLSAMSGRIMWLGGKVHIFAASADMSDTLFKFDETNSFSAQLLPLPPIERRYNEVRGTFLSPEDGFEPQDFPPVVDSVAQAEEGEVAFNLNLPFTHDHREAQRLAQIALRQARQPMMRLEAQPIGAAFAPMDVVAVSWKNLGVGFSGGIQTPEDFRITEQSISGGQGGQPMRVQLGLTREDASIYAWNPDVDEKERNIPVALRKPSGLENITPIDVVANPTTIDRQDGSQVAALSISWQTPLSLVSETYVDVRPAGQGEFEPWIPISIVTRFESDIIVTLPENTLVDVRVRHKLLNGMISEPVVVTARTDDVAGDGGGITWATLEGAGKPSDFADVTIDNQVSFTRLWDFSNNTLGWTAAGGSFATSFGLLRIENTNGDHQLISPAGLNIRGSDYTAIVIRASIIGGSSSAFAEPEAFYATVGEGAHGFDFAYRRRAPRRFQNNEFVTFVFDMENLTSGGDDWQNSIIDQIRIDLSKMAGDIFDIDFIGIARIGVGDFVRGSGLNLIANAYPTITDDSDTDNESQIVAERLEVLGITPGDIISASAQIRAPDGRGGTLLMRFREDQDNDIVGDFRSRTIMNQPAFEGVEINGITIPENADRVALILERSDGVTGTVVARRPALNVGSIAFTPINATVGAQLGTNIVDEDGLTPVGANEIRTADGQLTLDRLWDFKGTDLNWEIHNVSNVQHNRRGVRFTSANDTFFISPDNLNIDGGRNDKVAIRMRRITPGKGDFFEFSQLFYETDSHGFVPAFIKNRTVRFGDNTARTFVFDMADLTHGGDDWINSTIRRIRFDPSVTANDGFEVDWIGIGRVSAPAADIVAANLADGIEFEVIGVQNSSQIGVFGFVDIEEQGIRPGDTLSMGCEIISSGARRGQLEVIFEDSSNNDISNVVSPFVSSTTYQVVALEGYIVPQGCSRIRYRLLRESAGNGGVGARRPSLNRGSSLVGWFPVRPDVERRANRTTATSQLSDDAGLGQTAEWANVTGSTKPEDNANRSRGILANLNQVNTNEIVDGATSDRPQIDRGLNVPSINGGVKVSNDLLVLRQPEGQLITGKVRFRLDGPETIEPLRLEIRNGSNTGLAVLPITATNNYYTYMLNYWEDGNSGYQTYHMRVSTIGNVSLRIRVTSCEMSSLVLKK